VGDTVRACLVAAGADEDAKKGCFKRPDLKSEIADSMNMDASAVKDSKVREFAKKGMQGDTLDLLKNCDKSTKAGQDNCKAAMKEYQAKSSGKKAADITDDSLKRDADAALRGDLADKMKACVDSMSDKDEKTVKAECKDKLAASVIKGGDIEGKAPSQGKVEEYLRKAAASAGGDVMGACEGDRKACMTQAKERVAATMGKKGGAQVSTKDAEVFIRKGAANKAKDSALSCVEAKKDDATATCDDLYEKHLKDTGRTKPTDPAKQKSQKGRVAVEAAAALGKEVREVCFEKATKTEADTCLAGFKGQRDSVASEIFGSDAKVLKAKKKLAEDKATRGYLGDKVSACLKAASEAESNQDAMKIQCLSEMKKKKSVAGVTESQKDTLSKYSADKVAGAAQACEEAERKKCRASAKLDFDKTSGLPKREFAQVKKVGEIMNIAEVMAACKQESGTDADCLALAKAEFLSVTGTDAAAWDIAKERIGKVTQGIIDGKSILLRKKAQLSVDVQTDGTACDAAVAAKIAAKVKNVTVTPATSGVKKGLCRLVDGAPEYNVKVGTKDFTEAQNDAASDAISAAVATADLTRRLEGCSLGNARRLVAVTGAFAAQETDLCTDTDTSCGKADSDLVGATGATKPGTSGTVPTSEGMRKSVSVLVAAIFAMMLS